MPWFTNLEWLPDNIATNCRRLCSDVESFVSIKIYSLSTASISRKHCPDIISISYNETWVERLIHKVIYVLLLQLQNKSSKWVVKDVNDVAIVFKILFLLKRLNLYFLSIYSESFNNNQRYLIILRILFSNLVLIQLSGFHRALIRQKTVSMFLNMWSTGNCSKAYQHLSEGWNTLLHKKKTLKKI